MIDVHQLHKRYGAFSAIQDVSLTIPSGAIYGIIGASGAGKSTLLRMINLLERPTSGSVQVANQDLTKLSSRDLRKARKSIGMIFQHFHLVANKTVQDNVRVALELASYPKAQQLERVNECLRFVGLEDMSLKYPAELSGGQKQRVAIARALATNPSVLLCDEPTSSLDPQTTSEVLHVLQDINERFGITIVIVSHEMAVIKSICTHVTVLEQGRVYETLTHTPQGIQSPGTSSAYFVEQLKEGTADA